MEKFFAKGREMPERINSMKNPEHRVQTTKRLFRNALTSLLAEKPLRSITVKELCLRAKLNRGTFYAHYADIYDLMEQVEAEMTRDFFTALDPILSAIGQPTPPRVTKKVFQCIEANAGLCKAIIGPYGNKEFARNLMCAIRDRCVPFFVRFYPNADLARINAYFTFVSGGCLFLMEQWLNSGMQEPAAALADAAEKIMESGVGYLQQV